MYMKKKKKKKKLLEGSVKQSIPPPNFSEEKCL